MNSLKIRPLLILTAIMMLLTSSMSYAWTDNNADNWDMPSSGTVTSEKINTGIFQTVLKDFYWSSAKRTKMLTSNYFPTLDVHEDGAPGNVDGQAAWTTLPSAKIDVEDAAWWEGDWDTLHEEIEVVVTNPSEIVANQKYSFGAIWNEVNSADSSMIAYSAQSSAPIPIIGEDYNTVSGTIDFLGSHKKNTALSSSSPIVSEFSADITKPMPEYKLEQTKINPQITNQLNELKTITSKKQLDNYKKAADNSLELTTLHDAEYMISFNRPLSLVETSNLVRKYQLSESSLYYARAMNKSGEDVTIFGERLDDIELVADSQDFSLVGVIMIHGKDKTSTLKSVKTNNLVYGIEIQSENWIPTGLYYKLERVDNISVRAHR